MIRDTLEDTDITSSIDLDPAALPRVDLGEDTLQLDGEGTPGDPSVIDLREEPEKLGRDYQKLWLATAVTNLGDGVRVAALPLLAATLTRDPLFISGVLFASKLPWLLFSLHSGAIVDRVDRRSLIVRVNLLRALVMGIFGITLATGGGSLWLLYSIALLQGIGEVFSDNASFALMPKLVPRSRLEAANGRLEAAIVVFNGFAGPALGSLLFVAATAAPFALDASTFLVSALVMLSIAPAAKAQPKAADVVAGSTIRADIGEGLRWLRGHTLLRTLTLIGAATNLALNATFAIAVLFALEILGVGEIGFGLLLTIEAVGALLGSILAAAVRRRLGPASSVFLALGIASVANLFIATTSSWLVFGTMAAMIAFSGAVWNVVTSSLRQQLVPDELLGRVQSAHRLLAWGAIPVGTLTGGILSQLFGLRAPFVVAGVILCALALSAQRLLRNPVAPSSRDL